METKEKLEKLERVMVDLGLTKEEIINWLGLKGLQGAIIARPGMYYYADGTFSEKIMPYKQISGVIGWVDKTGKHGLVLGLREIKAKWAEDMPIGKIPESDGKKNTHLILEQAKKHGINAEAAKWCAAYTFDGIKLGQAFLPNKDELKKIFANISTVCKALAPIAPLKMSEWYWSSSVGNNNFIWVLSPNGLILTCTMSKNLMTRCVFNF